MRENRADLCIYGVADGIKSCLPQQARAEGASCIEPGIKCGTADYGG
jgi:hypothetical protein